MRFSCHTNFGTAPHTRHFGYDSATVSERSLFRCGRRRNAVSNAEPRYRRCVYCPRISVFRLPKAVHCANQPACTLCRT